MTAETLATIERLRAMGARRIRVGDVEVEFAGATPSEPRERERIPVEEMQRRAREQEEALLFAASG